MKNLLFSIIATALFAVTSQAQVAVTTDGSSLDNSAMLSVKSSTKGMLIPRMTAALRMAIVSPATSLRVYQTVMVKFRK
ncbi:MAG: hypothetical protein Q8M08_02205 [Bacteroidales bacterium]|nr:hypothetical protein [Bacteroidales bacterium]